MKNISLDITKAACFLEAGAVEAFEPKVKAAQQALEDGTCPGNDFLGWLHLPSSITPAFIDELQQCANVLRENCEAIVVAGIGGSYLGARAVIEALSNSFAWLVADKKNPTILFAGNNIGEDYLFELTEYLKDKKFGVINISKSGTTTETALTFRLLMLAGIAPARPGAVGRIAGALLYLDEGSFLYQRPEEKAHKAAYGAEHHPAQES